VNEQEMVSEMKESFPNSTVEVVHMEDLSICKQVQIAAEAAVLLGVHGAGLVHLWWLRDGAAAVELEPGFEFGNPTFRMLALLTGRNYSSEQIGGTSNAVSVNVKSLLKTIHEITV